MTRRLLLDVGNSRVKWTVADGDQLEPVLHALHEGDAAAALDRVTLPKVDEAWISDVTGPASREALSKLLRTKCGAVPRFAAAQARCLGLRCAYARPARLGVDRWLMLLAAWRATGRGACVASAGTALTFDAVDDAGQHLGGCIAPGLMAMQRAVLATTRFPADGPDDLYGDGLGRDTEACVRQGAVHAALGLLERLAQRFSANRAWWLTGGDAPLLMPSLDPRWEYRPALVLEGLLSLATAAGAP
ncbi:MAG TPA: type III pantothenate kinase [Nevskiaceae bacterium]